LARHPYKLAKYRQQHHIACACTFPHLSIFLLTCAKLNYNRDSEYLSC
jgi:hypothetical protein